MRAVVYAHYGVAMAQITGQPTLLVLMPGTAEIYTSATPIRRAGLKHGMGCLILEISRFAVFQNLAN